MSRGDGHQPPVEIETIRRFAERDAPVTRWTDLPRGGNFLPAEEPELFVEDVRTFFAGQQ